MRNLKIFFSLYIIFALFLHALLQAQDRGDFQLVESVPVGTTLGIEQTARTLPVWLEMVKSAQSTIDMEIFYLSHKPGEPLEEVLRALRDAAERGVHIRIIADARMAKTYPSTLKQLDHLPGIEVRPIEYFNEQGGVMHAKYFIVDREQLFLGSQNMDWRALKHIHELGARIRSGRLASLFTRLFEFDWRLAGEQNPELSPFPPQLPETLRITPDDLLILTGPEGREMGLYPAFSPQSARLAGIAWEETEILRLIDNARKRISIQLLSYKPAAGGEYYQKLDGALRRAAIRGVKVRMIVSNWNTREPAIRYLKSLQVIPNVEIHISAIPQRHGEFIPYARVEHCKYMVVDDQLVWLGTGNWSRDYFYESRNVSLVINSEFVNTMIGKIFTNSWNSSYTTLLDICKEYKPPKISGE